jgi:hypothetical protein
MTDSSDLWRRWAPICRDRLVTRGGRREIHRLHAQVAHGRELTAVRTVAADPTAAMLTKPGWPRDGTGSGQRLVVACRDKTDAAVIGRQPANGFAPGLSRRRGTSTRTAYLAEQHKGSVAEKLETLTILGDRSALNLPTR